MQHNKKYILVKLMPNIKKIHIKKYIFRYKLAYNM